MNVGVASCAFRKLRGSGSRPEAHLGASVSRLLTDHCAEVALRNTGVAYSDATRPPGSTAPGRRFRRHPATDSPTCTPEQRRAKRAACPATIGQTRLRPRGCASSTPRPRSRPRTAMAGRFEASRASWSSWRGSGSTSGCSRPTRTAKSASMSARAGRAGAVFRFAICAAAPCPISRPRMSGRPTARLAAPT